MKYIRTKEGRIIDLEKRYKDYLNNEERKQKTKNRLKFYKQCHHNVLKQSDNIEELCDCFSCGIETVKDISVARGWNINNRQIYGCILTDKGLIYVAKMNNKGELELL